MKLFIANVGVNSRDASERGIRSPIFDDGTFEFLPIKESRENAKFTHHKYSNITCFNAPQNTLARFVDLRYADYAVHNDPEFATFTYGDINSSRGSNLKLIKWQDILLFLARLNDYREGLGFIGSGRFYFIGYFTVDSIAEFDDGHPRCGREKLNGIGNNAHYIRLMTREGDTFRIVKGTLNLSRRFKTALEVTPEIAGLVFNGAYSEDSDTFVSKATGETILNKNGKPTRFKFFGSNTRTIQSYLDSDVPSEKTSLDELMRIIDKDCFLTAHS